MSIDNNEVHHLRLAHAGEMLELLPRYRPAAHGAAQESPAAAIGASARTAGRRSRYS